MEKDIKNIYFIGIGGIGMSNLARYFKANNLNVEGYDRVDNPVCKGLEGEGIKIHFEENIDKISASFMDKKSTLIVRTPAVPIENKELKYFRDNNYRILKRAEVLGMISREKKALCVAGTHGKTTTSMLIAHILKQSHVDCNAFLGGISNNYNTNLLLSRKSNYAVIEADEYDRSFHKLQPFMSVITSVDADHLDIYGTHQAYLDSFSYYSSLIENTLIIKKGLELNLNLKEGVKLFTYSVSDSSADFYSYNVRVLDGHLFFDCKLFDKELKNIEIGVPIMVNVENATAAMGMAYLLGVTMDELVNSVKSFKGTWRRFDFQIRKPNFTYIDDYAHHPEELKASIDSVKMLFPNKKITGIFQPHLYTRTRDFADAFVEALSLLDEVILLDIYPAREKPILGVTSKIIFDKLNVKKKEMATMENVFDVLVNFEPQVLMTLGAGNIDGLVEKIKKYYK